MQNTQKSGLKNLQIWIKCKKMKKIQEIRNKNVFIIEKCDIMINEKRSIL